MKKTFDVKRLTMLALLTTIALTIFVVESAIPTLVPIPGVKLGLANIVTLFCIKKGINSVSSYCAGYENYTGYNIYRAGSIIYI